MPEPSPAGPAPRPREVIHCAKCDAENLAGATRCNECGAHLYLGCLACGEGNLRTLTHCTKCGARLGRSRLNRIKDKVFRRFTALEMLVGAVVLIGLILLLVRLVLVMGSVAPEEPAKPEYEHTVPSKDPSKLPEGAEPAPKLD
jgi:uncharacterized membrane protein YvbJ